MKSQKKSDDKIEKEPKTLSKDKIAESSGKPDKTKSSRKQHRWSCTVISTYLEKYPLMVAAGVNTMLFLMTYLIYTPKFQFIDDPMMMLLVAGVGRTTEPTIFLNFSHVIIGWVLKQLYSITIDFPWYALYLISGLFVAHITYLYMIIKKSSNAAVVLLYSTYFFFVGVDLLINLQFTITSILISIAGFLLLITDVGDKNESDTSQLKEMLNVRSGIALMLIMMGFLIRFDGAKLGFVLTVPVFMLRLQPKCYSKIVPPIIMTAFGLVLCFGLAQLNKIAYLQKPYTQDFQHWNRLAGQFLGNNADQRVDKETIHKIINEVGWSANDFLMFKQWFYMNKELYNIENFNKILSKLPTRNVQVTLPTAFAIFKNILTDKFVQNCITIFLFTLFFLTLDLRTGFLVAAVLCLTTVLVFYMIFFIKPPPARVYFPMFSYVALLPLTLLNSDRFTIISKFGLWGKAVGTLLFIVLLLHGKSTFASYEDQNNYNLKMQRWYRQIIEEINPQRHQLHISWTGAVSWHGLAPFGKLSFLNNFIAPDSRLYPSTKTVLQYFDIDDIYLALATDENVFLVIHTPYVEYKLPLYRQYMIEHYNLDVSWEQVATNNAFRVYKISIK